jgi:hypothetical protein
MEELSAIVNDGRGAACLSYRRLPSVHPDPPVSHSEMKLRGTIPDLPILSAADGETGYEVFAA